MNVAVLCVGLIDYYLGYASFFSIAPIPPTSFPDPR